MAARESAMRASVVRALKELDAGSVENPVRPGTPDVNHILGWIELKKLDQWPVRPGSLVRVPHFTPQQRAWLTRRRNLGGAAHVLLKVRNDWLLFDGRVAAQILGVVTKERLYECALAEWKKFDGKSLLERVRETSLAMLAQQNSSWRPLRARSGRGSCAAAAE